MKLLVQRIRTRSFLWPTCTLCTAVLFVSMSSCARQHLAPGGVKSAALSAAVGAKQPQPAPSAVDRGKGEKRADSIVSDQPRLSAASRLMIKACDNYLFVNPSSAKITEVLLLKASVLYNNKLMAESRAVYATILDKEPKGAHAIEAVRMTAQTFYEEQRFDEAQAWYRKLKEIAGDGGDKQEAVARIAESIFKLGESYEQRQRYKDAATEYERVALEFSDSKIADVALFNAGLANEKLAEWPQAILMYQRLLQKYLSSKLLVKAQFRSAKCYEKLMQWENAGETYLRVVANYPQSELAPVALYNAGFSFENAGKLAAAAATFEKLAQLYPKSEEVADMLFKAGEIYGKIKDWSGVTRVNQEFSKRFGSDGNRVVQAQCMIGVALYMQNKPSEALMQLQQAVATYVKLNNPSAVNKYYAAKAEFTIAEINLEAMNKITLTLPKDAYKRQLNGKMDALEKAITHYTKVVSYQISEWTTRSVYQIGQSYEDFALGIFKQQRQQNLPIDERLALELGIARAVEEYCVAKAAHFHEQNIKLGIKEKIEDKFILQSRKKITSLPLMAGENYLALVEIAQSAAKATKAEGFALIAKKLEMLQKIAPFQERAINLFLKCLELGSQYQETDEYYVRASGLITNLSFKVGQTYAEVADIARDAPIPSAFDAYEAFVYKTKLLKQIEGYEDKALENYLRTVKIAEAYKIDDEYVKQARLKLPELLFVRGRCYDLLCQSAASDPPFPKNATAAEKEEYQARFEEIALRFQENAFDIYKTILSYAKQNYAVGDYVTHAYVRLFQNSPKDFGVKKETMEDKTVSSGPEWKCLDDSVPGWNSLDCGDQTWYPAHKGSLPKGVTITGFPSSVPAPLWYGEGDPKTPQSYTPAQRLYARRTFYCSQAPGRAMLYCAAIDQAEVFLNGKSLPQDTALSITWNKAQKWDLVGKLREGKNVIAVVIQNNIKMGYGLLPYLTYSVIGYDYLPQPPGAGAPMEPALISEEKYRFPPIKNFPAFKRQQKKEG
ncbi:MAG TPA: tetratricopeptide repeat protein [Chitinivibrionales bacterium]